MEFGQFSLSLAVKDMNVSQDFYEKMGFMVIDGGHKNEGYPDTDETSWRILQKDGLTIGLFKGMFDHNILTFNPPDVRAVQKMLKDADIKLTKEADMSKEGPDHITLEDPDGNHIMFDQW